MPNHDSTYAWVNFSATPDFYLAPANTPGNVAAFNPMPGEDFDLSGANIQGSDVYDQIRNADRKEAMMPMGPKKTGSLASRQSVNKFYGDRFDIERALEQLRNDQSGMSPATIERLRNKYESALRILSGK